MYTKNIENSFFVIFSATWLIRYVEKLHRIFTSSKPRLTGVNFPPWNKNWHENQTKTSSIHTRSKFHKHNLLSHWWWKFAQAQNCSNCKQLTESEWSITWGEICNPNGQDKSTSTKIPEANEEWIFHRSKHWQFAETQNSNNRLNINQNRMVHHGVKNLQSKWARHIERAPKLLQQTRSEFSITI